MGENDLKFYRSPQEAPLSGPSGMIEPDDVVLIKVNAQWKYRGCTNSDLIRGLIRAILDHPDGFSSYTGTSDNTFAIVAPPPPAITVVSPNGGNTWSAGSTQRIQWSYAGNVGGFVKIELLQGGAVIRTITSSASVGSGGNGSYNWKIPSNQALGSDYAIRVTSRSNTTYIDTSDSNFSMN